MKKQWQGEPDIVGLIMRVQEQITLLGNKVDILVNRFLPKPDEIKPLPKPFQHPVNTHVQNGGRQDNRYRERLMHKAVCADCRKECEIPFRPSGDRPVYCQECFKRRKTGNSFKASIDNRPKEAAPAQVTNIVKPRVSEKKKSLEKKKPVSKKRKKK